MRIRSAARRKVTISRPWHADELESYRASLAGDAEYMGRHEAQVRNGAPLWVSCHERSVGILPNGNLVYQGLEYAPVSFGHEGHERIAFGHPHLIFEVADHAIVERRGRHNCRLMLADHAYRALCEQVGFPLRVVVYRVPGLAAPFGLIACAHAPATATIWDAGWLDFFVKAGVAVESTSLAAPPAPVETL